MTDNTGKTWFTTGTSRGTGRGWAEAALERGDRVAATSRNTESLDDLVQKHDEVRAQTMRARSEHNAAPGDPKASASAAGDGRTLFVTGITLGIHCCRRSHLRAADA